MHEKVFVLKVEKAVPYAKVTKPGTVKKTVRVPASSIASVSQLDFYLSDEAPHHTNLEVELHSGTIYTLDMNDPVAQEIWEHFNPETYGTTTPQDIDEQVKAASNMMESFERHFKDGWDISTLEG